MSKYVRIVILLVYIVHCIEHRLLQVVGKLSAHVNLFIENTLKHYL